MQPAGIGASPILCGSMVMESTPGRVKSKSGKLYPKSLRNGITNPPNAASTCK